MFRMRRFGIGAAVAVAIVASSTALAQEPLIVVSAKNYAALENDARFIFTGGGAERFADQAGLLDSMIEQLTRGKGLIGLDRAKPLGLYVTIGPGGGPVFVLYVPVSSEKEFRDLLKMIYPRQQALAGGMLRMEAEERQMYAKFAQGHCFLSLRPEALTRLPDPAKFPRSPNALNVEANTARMNADFKDGLLEQLQEAVGEVRLEPEKPEAQAEKPDAFREFRQKLYNEMLRVMIQETERFSIGLAVDQKSKMVAADVSMVAKPGTSLASAVAGYQKAPSSFAALAGPDSALSLTMATPMIASTRMMLRDLINTQADKLHARIDSRKDRTDDQKKAVHALVHGVVKTITATGDTGQLDLAVVFDSLPGGKAQLVAASKVAKAEELSKVLEEFAKSAANDTDRLKLDVDKHADARIHSVTLDRDGGLKEFVGEGVGHLAITSDAVFFAAGGDSLADVKSAMDKMGQPGPKRPPVSLRASPSKFFAIVGRPGAENFDLIKEILAGDGDHLSLEVLAAERGARVRLELGEACLRFLALSIQKFNEATE